MEKLYKEFLEAQHELAGKELPKTGFNKFGNFKYYELDDILPAVQEVCYNHSLLVRFEFRESEGVLVVNHVENPQIAMRWAVPMPELKEMPRMNIMQTFGSYLTYIKRYLLLNAFLLSEKSVIDSTEYSKVQDTNKKEKPEFQTAKQLKEKESPKSPAKQVNKVREPPEEDVLEDYFQIIYNDILEDGKEPTQKLLLFRAGKYHKQHPDELDLNDLKQLRKYIRGKVPPEA